MRREALAVADGDLELVEFADDRESWYVCKHDDQPNKEMGKGTEAGIGCALFEAPTAKGLDPALERLLARREGR
jgi:hypothetical protein